MLPPSRTFVRVMLMLSVVAVAAFPAHAQSLSTLPSGTRVRLVLSDSLRQSPISRALQVVTGSLVRVTNDSVWLQPRGASAFSVSQAAIRGSQVSRGSSRARSALVFGLAIGVAAAAVERGRDHGRDDFALFGLTGFGVGAAVGFASPFEQWRRIRR